VKEKITKWEQNGERDVGKKEIGTGGANQVLNRSEGLRGERDCVGSGVGTSKRTVEIGSNSRRESKRARIQPASNWEKSGGKERAFSQDQKVG